METFLTTLVVMGKISLCIVILCVIIITSTLIMKGFDETNKKE